MSYQAYAVVEIKGKEKTVKCKDSFPTIQAACKSQVMLKKDLKDSGLTPIRTGYVNGNPKIKKNKTNTSKKPTTKNTSTDTSMNDVKGMYSFKAARGNHVRGPFEMTLKQAIDYASEWSEDSDWDYEYGVDFMSINVYRDGKPIGYVDDNNGEWHRGRTVKEV